MYGAVTLGANLVLDVALLTGAWANVPLDAVRLLAVALLATRLSGGQ